MRRTAGAWNTVVSLGKRLSARGLTIDRAQAIPLRIAQRLTSQQPRTVDCKRRGCGLGDSHSDGNLQQVQLHHVFFRIAAFY